MIKTEVRKEYVMDRREELFGKLCRDKITGFTGVCTGQTKWLYGCDQFILSPRVTEDNPNELKDGKWFDEGRIEIIEEFVKPEDVQVEKTGGVYDDSMYASNSRM